MSLPLHCQVHACLYFLLSNAACFSSLPVKFGHQILTNLLLCLLCSLCKAEWQHASCYNQQATSESGVQNTWRKTYLKLDEACLTLNADVEEGVRYCESRGLVDSSAGEWARFLMGTSAKHVHLETRRRFFERRPAALDALCPLLDFRGEFLPNALRRYFAIVAPPAQRDAQLSLVLNRFARRYSATNPDVELDMDTVYVLCYSLILLSVSAPLFFVPYLPAFVI